MRKYTVHKDAYMFEPSEMFSVEAENDQDAILEAHNLLDPEEREYAGFEDETIDEIVENLIDANGDGQPYVTIFSVNDNKKIFG